MVVDHYSVASTVLNTLVTPLTIQTYYLRSPNFCFHNILTRGGVY